MSSHDESAVHAQAAAGSAREAGEALDALAQAMSRRDFSSAVQALTKAMTALTNLELGLAKARDAGMAAAATMKPVHLC
jgi:hypothetical protein